MDNLHPYPIMPSHASKMTADGFSYWDHLCGTRGEKDLEWEHVGKLYRSAFAFRNPGKSRKAEYYLFEKGAAGDWVPLQLPDGTLSDGKADTYNRCIEAVLGSPEAFFTSVFSAQNRRPIASYQPARLNGCWPNCLASTTCATCRPRPVKWRRCSPEAGSSATGAGWTVCTARAGRAVEPGNRFDCRGSGNSTRGP